MKVYIAGPMTLGDSFAHVGDAIRVYNELMDMGHVPFCPQFTAFAGMVRKRPIEEWMRCDFEWLGVCDALLRLPGESKGADREVAFAREHSIPVVFSLNELRQSRIIPKSDQLYICNKAGHTDCSFPNCPHSKPHTAVSDNSSDCYLDRDGPCFLSNGDLWYVRCVPYAKPEQDIHNGAKAKRHPLSLSDVECSVRTWHELVWGETLNWPATYRKMLEEVGELGEAIALDKSMAIREESADVLFVLAHMIRSLWPGGLLEALEWTYKKVERRRLAALAEHKAKQR